jgi:AAHS family 4-hydroxybenzoate transporter-like MFS transporter
MAPSQIVDITRLIDGQRIRWFNISLVLVSFFVVLTDGYDIGAAAVAAPALVKEWHLDHGQLGPMFSAGLFAGLFGPPIFGFFADRYGRKAVIVGGAVFFGIFTLASVLATSLMTMIVLRFIAGIGISGVLPIAVALNNEYAPRRIRATMIVVMFSGVTFGGGLPGVIAANFMADYGWQVLFWVGGLLPVAAGLLAAFILPESPKFLALRPDRQKDLATLARRINPDVPVSPDAQFVISGEQNRARFSIKAIFAGRLALLTPMFWITNAVNLMIFYFVNQWMPILLSTAGVTVEHAAIATTLFQFGGTLAGLIIMRPLDKYGFIPVPILFACAIPVMASIGQPGLSEGTIMVLVGAAGFCLLGLQFGNISLESNIYPTYIRSWGVGSCFAAGRVGSVFGPLVGGILVARHVPLQDMFYIASVPLAVGLIAAIVITPLYKTELRHQLALADNERDAAWSGGVQLKAET